MDADNFTARYFLQVGLIFVLCMSMLILIYGPMVHMVVSIFILHKYVRFTCIFGSSSKANLLIPGRTPVPIQAQSSFVSASRNEY